MLHNTSNKLGYLVVALAVLITLIACNLSILGSVNETREITGIDLGSIPQTRGADGQFILGDSSAPVKIILFTDFFCPACQQYKPQIDQLIENEVMAGKAQLEMRMIITAGGENMRTASQLAECSEVSSPGTFWSAQEVLFAMAQDREFYSDAPEVLARKLGIDVNALVQCMPSADQVTVDLQYARSIGVSSTPTVLYIIKGEDVPRPIPGDRGYPSIKTLIDLHAP